MMTRLLCAVLFGAICAGLTLARPDTKTNEAKVGSDQHFAKKATAGGLAEVNLGNLAAKQASDPAVKRFATHMVKDHSKANKELLKLANAKKISVATTMGAEHKKLMDKLGKLSGAEFDRVYMEGQVKDHKDTIALFEKEAKNGTDEDLRDWAKKTLPTLRMHLKMAQKVQDGLKGSKGGSR